MEINGCVSADKVGPHQSRGQRDTNLRGFLERLFVVVLSGGYPMGFKWRMTYPPWNQQFEHLKKWMVGRLVSFWDGLQAGAMFSFSEGNCNIYILEICTILRWLPRLWEEEYCFFFFRVGGWMGMDGFLFGTHFQWEPSFRNFGISLEVLFGGSNGFDAQRQWLYLFPWCLWSWTFCQLYVTVIHFKHPSK